MIKDITYQVDWQNYSYSTTNDTTLIKFPLRFDEATFGYFMQTKKGESHFLEAGNYQLIFLMDANGIYCHALEAFINLDGSHTEVVNSPLYLTLLEEGSQLTLYYDLEIKMIAGHVTNDNKAQWRELNKQQTVKPYANAMYDELENSGVCDWCPPNGEEMPGNYSCSTIVRYQITQSVTDWYQNGQYVDTQYSGWEYTPISSQTTCPVGSPGTSPTSNNNGGTPLADAPLLLLEEFLWRKENIDLTDAFEENPCANIEDEEELYFYTPEIGVIIIASGSWEGYQRLIELNRLEDLQAAFYISEKIISDKAFLNSWKKQ